MHATWEENGTSRPGPGRRPCSRRPGWCPTLSGSRDQLVETYSVIRGVPRYLESWSDRRPVLANIHEEILSPVSIFQNEPAFLIHDEIADPRPQLALLEPIGVGMRRPVDIARVAGENCYSTQPCFSQRTPFPELDSW